MTTERDSWSKERVVQVRNGWAMLVAVLLVFVGDILLFIYCAVEGSRGYGHSVLTVLAVLCVVMVPVLIVTLTGFFTLQPNQARVLVLFGKYCGTVRKSGFHWGNPFYSNGSVGGNTGKIADMSGTPDAARSGAQQKKGLHRNKISLRARTINGAKLKVNDNRGNPIEIAAVIVWRVEDTAQATFDVDDYELYVETQSESALRHLASQYSYDHGEDNEITLRSNVDEVSAALKTQLEE